MRSHIAKPLRDIFETRLKARFPQFVQAADAEVPDTMRVFQWKATGVAVFVALQWHRSRDSFTVELSWDRKGQYPAFAMVGDPPAEPTPQARFRIAQLWEGSGIDRWWDFNLSPDLPKQEIKDKVRSAVDDVLGHLERDAMPYLEAMALSHTPESRR